MATINRVDMPNFDFFEFNIDPKFISPALLYGTQAYRTMLGCAVEISKANGSIARFDGRKTSTHRILFDEENRIIKPSTGIDTFCRTHIFKAWTVALNSNLWGGIGVYFDTNGNNGEFWPMLHLDLRPSPLIWYRDNGEYYYPTGNKTFFKNLQNLFMIHRIDL